MKYTTTDELEHFSFTEAYIADVQVTGGFFHMTLSNVTILPENSCNRDIREMRANDLVLKIEEPVIRSLVREGYKVYDANGILMRTCEDEMVNEYDLTLFIREESDLYRKYEELHYQKAYELEQVKELLLQAGMEFVAAYDAFTHNPVTAESERMYIIARPKRI